MEIQIFWNLGKFGSIITSFEISENCPLLLVSRVWAAVQNLSVVYHRRAEANDLIELEFLWRDFCPVEKKRYTMWRHSF